MTIAKFSIIKVGIFAAANLTIAIVVLYYSFHRSPGAAFWQITLSPRVWIHGRFVALFVSPFIIVMVLNFVRRVIFAGGSSVWIASDEPRLLNFYSDAGFSRVLLTEIDHFSIVPSKAFRPAMVALHLKNGLLERIPTLLMAESAESIKDRLTASMF
jgi:hypothetical protein